MLTSDLIDAAEMLLKYGIQYLAKDASDNMLRAINALRCMMTGFSDNAWNFLASAYWVVVTFGYKEEANKYVDELYQNVCTCQEDAKFVSKLMGSGDKSTEMISGCSELTGNKKLEADEKRKKFVELRKQANEKALIEAAAKKRKEELEKELDGKDDEQMEKESLKKFLEYKTQAQNIAKKTVVGEKDKIALKRAKMEFDCMKKAKRVIQTRKRKSKMRDLLKKTDGLKTIIINADQAVDELDNASRKRDEFPEDEQTNLEVEIAEAKVDAIADAGEEIDADGELGLKERPKMSIVIKKIREKRYYNNMWKDAKKLYLDGEKDELKTMMDTVKEEYTTKKEAYEYAVKKKA